MEPTNREILDAVTNLDKTVHRDILDAVTNLGKTVRHDISETVTSLGKTVRNEILDAVVNLNETIQGLATHMDEHFNQVDERFSDVDERFDRVESDITSIKSTMVTKVYLDDRLADLRGDLITLARKQNRKLETVVEEFVSQGLLTRAAADRLLALEPFPQ